MRQLYPLKFDPIFKEKIWGGRKIQSLLGFDFDPLPNCGEIWLLSSVPGEISVVQNGFLKGNELNELIEVYMGDLVGEQVYENFGNSFPLLMKIIDAAEALSVQVHPDDDLAFKRHQCAGKTEMWYVLQADKGAELISGFNRKLNRERYLEFLSKQQLSEVLNMEKVNEGDVFYMPSGRVHAIGKGILLAEIQQTSDITYRIFDWNRKDTQGNPRELHTELALEALDFSVYDSYKTHYRKLQNTASTLLKENFAQVNLLSLNQSIEVDYSDLDSFVAYLAVKGDFVLHASETQTSVKYGECVLIPASIDQLSIFPHHEAEILEIHL